VSVTLGQLIVRLGEAVVQTVSLNVPVITIGRELGNSVVLPETRVSRHHAEIRLESSGVILIDVGSPNGTYVDGVRLLAHQPHLLLPGSVVQIGPYQLLYQQPDAAQPADVVMDAAPVVPLVEMPSTVAPARSAARPRSPVARAKGPMSAYLRDLPIIYQDDDFIGRFLLIFESIWEPLEQRQDQIAMYFDPRTCPEPFLPWLAGWLALSLDEGWPESRKRLLVARAMELYRARGTTDGLRQMIEVCTGLSPEIEEVAGEPFVFRVTVADPPGDGVDRRLVEQLIVANKPAHAGYRLEFRT
jgi:phage tail-like protein